MRKLTHHLSHYLPAHMAVFLEDLASFGTLLLSTRAPPSQSEGYPPCEADLGGCTPPGADYDPDSDTSGTSPALSTAENPSRGCGAGLAKPSPRDIANRADHAGAPIAESAPDLGRISMRREDNEVSTSCGGTMPDGTGGRAHGVHGIDHRAVNPRENVGRGSHDVVDEDRTLTSEPGDDSDELSGGGFALPGKEAVAQAPPPRDLSLMSSWGSTRFKDHNVEQQFRLGSAVLNHKVRYIGYITLHHATYNTLHYSTVHHITFHSLNNHGGHMHAGVSWCLKRSWTLASDPSGQEGISCSI